MRIRFSRAYRSAALALAASSVVPAHRSMHAQVAAAPASRLAIPDSIRDFAGLVAQLSERGGYFNTDNLISNEASYLHVVGQFAKERVAGGIYIGVGPDQNFSYIARIRPRAAFLIDIRRDNMLQHLMFKALFERAGTRADYLALLLGRPSLPTAASRSDATLPAILAAIDARPATEASARTAVNAVRAAVVRYGVPLSPDDLSTIERFHRAFIDGGLELQFTTTGRPPRDYYPTLRRLLLERDADGNQASYLARETDFQFLKSMQRRNLIVPVVGDLGGSHALVAIGNYVREHDARVSAMYVSNAEDYLLRDGSFVNYAKSVAALPRTPTTVMIRSWFGGPRSHPASIGDYHSTQLLQRMDDFVEHAKAVRFYRELVMYRYLGRN